MVRKERSEGREEGEGEGGRGMGSGVERKREKRMEFSVGEEREVRCWQGKRKGRRLRGGKGSVV